MHTKTEACAITHSLNSAWRCHMYLEELAKNPGIDNCSAFGAMLEIPAFDRSNPDHQELVRMGISHFRRHAKLILQALKQNASIPPELYQSITNVYNALGQINNLDAALNQQPALVGESASLSFGWAACYLPASGDTIDYEQIAEILADVMDLKARIASTQLPTEITDFVDDLLRSLEQAVIDSKFVGSKPLERAYRQATGELQAAEEQLKQSAQSLNPAQREYLSEMATKVEKVGKIATGLAATLGFAKSVVALIAN